MLRIDGFYLYELGYRINGVSQIEIFSTGENKLHTCSEARAILYQARFALEEFMTRSVYKMRTLQKTAQEFRGLLEWAMEHCETKGKANDIPDTNVIFQVQEKHREFEAVLRGEFAAADIYLVMQKSAFDTNTLIEFGELAFPHETGLKTPEALEDLRQAMRCIAFELPTAAAFHLHRANETVLGRYWDSVTKDTPRPKNQTLGSYIGELERLDVGSDIVISALRDIKNLHRNPTIHADSSLETVEEAINLQGAIRAEIGSMLQVIPEVSDGQQS